MIRTFLSAILVAAAMAYGSYPAIAQGKPLEKLQIPNVSSPVDGLLVGGQPAKRDLLKIKELGFQTIISLRPKQEDVAEIDYDEQAETNRLGMKFVRIPIISPMDLNEKNISLLDMALAEANGKAFVHCRTGNRVGAMLALRAFHMQNISVGEAIALGKKAGIDKRYQTAVEEILNEARSTPPE